MWLLLSNMQLLLSVLLTAGSSCWKVTVTLQTGKLLLTSIAQIYLRPCKNDVDNAQIRGIGWQLPHDIMQRLRNVSNILKCIVICHFKAFVDTLSCSCNAVAVLLHKVAEVACVQSFYLRCGYCCYCEYKQFKLRHQNQSSFIL